MEEDGYDAEVGFDDVEEWQGGEGEEGEEGEEGAGDEEEEEEEEQEEEEDAGEEGEGDYEEEEWPEGTVCVCVHSYLSMEVLYRACSYTCCWV